MSVKNVFRLLVILLCVTMLTGCSSKKEVRDRAFVQAVGVENDNSGNIKVAVRIFNDDETYSGVGKNFFNALDNAQQTQGKYFFTGHTEIVISSLDENNDILEEMIKSHDVPLSCWFISADNAVDVISSADCDRLVGIIEMKSEMRNSLEKSVWECYRNNTA